MTISLDASTRPLDVLAGLGIIQEQPLVVQWIGHKPPKFEIEVRSSRGTIGVRRSGKILPETLLKPYLTIKANYYKLIKSTFTAKYNRKEVRYEKAC